MMSGSTRGPCQAASTPSPPSLDCHKTATTNISLTSTEPAHPRDDFNEYYVLLWYNTV
jgi:hypothetical protein